MIALAGGCFEGDTVLVLHRFLKIKTESNQFKGVLRGSPEGVVRGVNNYRLI